jgi:uncharacterized phage protein (TIGR02216 family)
MSFPWEKLMHLGLGQLRLPPHTFWSMTLKELSAALGRKPLDVKALRQLMNDHD